MHKERLLTLLEEYATVPEIDYLKTATADDIEKTLRLYERLTAMLKEVEAEIALEKYQLSMIEDQLQQALESNLHAARNIMVRRRCIDLQGAIKKIENWLTNTLGNDA